MRWRADAKQIHRCELAVLVVAERNEAFRTPAVREQLPVTVGHPWKVVATIEQGGQVDDLMVFVEVLPAGESGGEKPDGVAGRHLDVLPASTGMDVVEV